MKKSTFLLLLVLAACGGSLSDEQRKKMREASEQQTILKVTDAEITAEAFAKGRRVLEQLKAGTPDTARIETQESVAIHWLGSGQKHGLAIEQQLIEAYLTSMLSGSPLADNVQKIGTDSLVYTSPVVLTRADSSIEIRGTWNVWMSKQQVIVGMKKK